jgi:hypothetical protein
MSQPYRIHGLLQEYFNFLHFNTMNMHVTACVVEWPGLMATDPEVPGSIPNALCFSDKQWVGLEQGPLGLMRIIKELMK